MKVLILGGGVGGHVVANLLRKRMGKKHDVVLVDKQAQYKFSPSFLWATMGWREPRQITRNLSLLERKGIKYVNGEVLKIDPAERTVKSSVGEFTYDYLIVALGAELAPETMPGLSDAAHHFYELDASMKLRDVLKAFSGGTVAIGVSSTPFKCPAAPYEAALVLDYDLRKRGIRDKADFQFFTPEPLPMPVAGPVIGNEIRQMLESRGINYHPNLKPVSVDPKKREISFEKGDKIRFDLLVAVPPHRVPNVVKEAGLTEGMPWIPVDKWTLRTRYDDLYAIGDVTMVKLFDGMALPKAGVFAHGQAEVVARNIVADIEGGEGRKFNGKGYCFIETGFGKAGLASGEFYAEPRVVNIKSPKVSRIWHLGKVLFEKYWLWRWF
jgi:sulfide:quinone oxidoreductase